jgi:membrane-bound inhibitor of C-type lysozyme
MKRILVVALLVALAACKPPEGKQPPPAPAAKEGEMVLNWTCENGDAFRMTIFGDRVDFLFKDGITATMAPAIAASGNLFKAANGTDLFHTKGAEGFLQFGGKETNCTTPDLGE